MKAKDSAALPHPQDGRFPWQGSWANKISPAKTREALLVLFMSEVKRSKACPPLFWGAFLIFVSLFNSGSHLGFLIACKRTEATNVTLPNWCMALTGLRAVKKPSAVGSGDILREAADTALHGSTPSLPLLLLPQRAEGDFFPFPPGMGDMRCRVPTSLAGRRLLCRQHGRTQQSPTCYWIHWRVCFFQELGRCKEKGYLNWEIMTFQYFFVVWGMILLSLIKNKWQLILHEG